MSLASPTRPTGRLFPTLSYRRSRSGALMLCQRFVRTTPGDTALTRIGANSTARARVSFEPASPGNHTLGPSQNRDLLGKQNSLVDRLRHLTAQMFASDVIGPKMLTRVN